MKKTILVSLAGLTLFLAGCTQQAPTANQGITQPTANVNQNTNQPTANLNQNLNQPVVNQNTNQSAVNVNTNQTPPTEDWLTYSGYGFELKYPSYLSKTEVKKVGGSTTISFKGRKISDDSSYESLISIWLAPNQGGSTLEEQTNEITRQGPYKKIGETSISGLNAHILIIPESDAPIRYYFTSPPTEARPEGIMWGRILYDLTLQNFDQETKDKILTSIKFTSFTLNN